MKHKHSKGQKVKEREITQRLVKRLRKDGWIVYKVPDTYGDDKNCPQCGGMTYCRNCAAFVTGDRSSRFTPYKPADIAVLRTPGNLPGFWLEVKRVTARTEKGMVFRPKYVKPHQVKALTESEGRIALGFVQICKPEKNKLIGLYVIRWSAVKDLEEVSREQISRASGYVMVDKEVIPVKVKKEEDPVFPFLEGGNNGTP